MGQVPTIELPEGLLDLKTALEAEWPQRIAALRTSGFPLNEGEEEDAAAAAAAKKAAEEAAAVAAAEEAAAAEGMTVEQLQAELKKTREEAAKRRVEAREAQARAQQYEDQNKTESQKLEERATEAEKRAAEAEGSSLRLEVALDKAPEGMSIAQVRKLAKRLTGTTREDLEADADELFADFTPAADQESATRRPRERLRPGAAPSAEPEETDPAKLAAQVPRPY